jgi:hypothetical protein
LIDTKNIPAGEASRDAEDYSSSGGYVELLEINRAFLKVAVMAPNMELRSLDVCEVSEQPFFTLEPSV